MRIDLHCHTKKVKKGDPQSREIDPYNLVQKLINNQVSIAAITNHNCFDKKYYEEATELANNSGVQIWPGIELDIHGKNSEGHCIIISNPHFADRFSDFCNNLNITDPDKWKITIYDLCILIQKMDVIVIAHYGKKAHSLSDDDIEELSSSLDKNIPFYLEPSNLRSAGIYFAKNKNCLIGSDVRDWEKYSGSLLPELKLPIKDYDHFLMLIKKDKQVITTFLDSKKAEEIRIAPFNDCELAIPIYNDVNVFFGGKGTGKSIILESIKQYYEGKGISDISFYSSENNSANYKQIITINNEDSDYDYVNLDDCSECFDELMSWKEAPITDIRKYVDWANTKEYNKLSKSFGFKKASFSTAISHERINNVKKDIANIENIKKHLNDILYLNEYLSDEDIDELNQLLLQMHDSAKNAYRDEWIIIKSLELEKKTIELMKNLCTIKSGAQALPISTGLLETYITSRSLGKTINSIKNGLNDSVHVNKKPIGEIQEKGQIYLCKEITLNPDALKNAKLPPNALYKISDFRSFKKDVELLSNLKYSQEKEPVLQRILTFINENKIESLRDFVCIKGKIINKTGEEYKPSNGEQSMLMLSNSLMADKNIYFLDEPEQSVGHDYINTVIVPRIIELAQLGKRIIICTHDANIAVRTLPMLSVYREYKGNDKYATYLGSAFIDLLVNTENDKDIYSWTEKSLETLEGGEQAFMERRVIYG